LDVEDAWAPMGGRGKPDICFLPSPQIFGRKIYIFEKLLFYPKYSQVISQNDLKQLKCKFISTFSGYISPPQHLLI
jgi:hypothetical protein